MERIRNILPGIMFTVAGACLFNTMFAQTPSERSLISTEIRKINTERKLVAEKVNIKMETAAIDSIQMQYEADTEDDMSPADELYDGVWDNQSIMAYTDVAIPDSFQIDLSSFVMPVEGKITSPFGHRRRRFHYGTDLKLQIGDTVYAAFEGKVRVERYDRRGYGYFLVLRHPNGLETLYGHLSDFLVSEGQSVEAGQPIALGGSTGRSTGPHLHFECRFLGQAIDPSYIVDFDNFCTYEDSYTFQRYKINEVSIHNSRYAQNNTYKYNNNTSYNAYTRSTGDAIYHRIRSGDTLSKIAQQHGVPVSKLCRLNGLQRTSVLRVGRTLRCS